MKTLLLGTPRDLEIQRQVIQGFLASIAESICRQEDNDEITFLFFQARAYLVSHFEAEEAMMKSTRYPDLDGHKREHIFVTNELDRISEALTSGRSYRAEDHRLVRDLVADHNNKSDILFVNYLRRADTTSDFGS